MYNYFLVKYNIYLLILHIFLFIYVFMNYLIRLLNRANIIFVFDSLIIGCIWIASFYRKIATFFIDLFFNYLFILHKIVRAPA